MKKKTRKAARVEELSAAPAEASQERPRKATVAENTEGGEETTQTKNHKQKNVLPRKWKSAELADEKRQQDLEKRNSLKYHYLKFIERQKVERNLNKTRRKLEAAQEAGDKKAVKTFGKDLRSHLADYEYVTHYPKHIPYNSLFPKEDSERSQKRREQVRCMIREKLAAKCNAESRDEANACEAPGMDAESEDDVGGRKLALQKRKAPKTPEAQLEKQIPSEGAPPTEKKMNKKNMKARQKRDLKRKMAQAERSDQVAAAEGPKTVTGHAVEGDSGNTKRKSKLLRKAAAVEEVASDSVERKKRMKASSEGDVVHPSWQASKSAKVSGSIVKATGNQMAFDSDSE